MVRRSRSTLGRAASAGRSRVRVLAPKLFLASLAGLVGTAQTTEYCLRFYGNGSAAPDLDRIKIALDDPHRPVDVGASDLTVEWWMKAPAEENTTGPCRTGSDNWIYGNILFDRDVWGGGDWGDWGVSVAGGRIAFGVAVGSNGDGICSAAEVTDGSWHHVAVTRRASDGRLQIFIDGVLSGEAEKGPVGNLSYRDGRTTSREDDPFLVIGAEKHDVGGSYPAYSGWLDEVRLSTVLRYTAQFTPQPLPFSTDASTAALYHFNEGSGTVAFDSSGATGGPSDGVVLVGGSPAGPQWSTESPLRALLIFADDFETGDFLRWSAVEQ